MVSTPDVIMEGNIITDEGAQRSSITKEKFEMFSYEMFSMWQGKHFIGFFWVTIKKTLHTGVINGML